MSGLAPRLPRSNHFRFLLCRSLTDAAHGITCVLWACLCIQAGASVWEAFSGIALGLLVINLVIPYSWWLASHLPPPNSRVTRMLQTPRVQVGIIIVAATLLIVVMIELFA